MRRWFLDLSVIHVSVVLGSVGDSWMCRWFLDLSVVLGCVGDS